MGRGGVEKGVRHLYGYFRKTVKVPDTFFDSQRALLLLSLLLGFHSFGSPLASAEVYLTKEQALSLVLGEGSKHLYQPMEIPESLQTELLRSGLATERIAQAHFFEGRKGDVVTGYALIDSEVGKHLPITYIVGISPTGSVTRVEMMVFREIRGWEARERRFMAQFEEKNGSDELTVGGTLRNVTGATLSSRAIARGVKRALFLWNHFYGVKSKEKADA